MLILCKPEIILEDIRAELYMLSLMHMHRVKELFLVVLVSLVRQMHQVRLRKVHPGGIILTSKATSLHMHQGDISSSSAPKTYIT
jgi:hypothetical protein